MNNDKCICLIIKCICVCVFDQNMTQIRYCVKISKFLFSKYKQKIKKTVLWPEHLMRQNQATKVLPFILK